MLKTRTLALALVAPALALTACGGSSDKDKITDIVNDVSASPVAVCDHLSDRLLQNTFKGSVEVCKTRGKDEKSDGKADIQSVDIKGDAATVKLTDKSGDATVRFAKEDGEWVVSSVDSAS